MGIAQAASHITQCEHKVYIRIFSNVMTMHFLFVTNEEVKSSIPSSHEVIQYMDSLFDALDDYVGDKKLFPAINMAAV